MRMDYLKLALVVLLSFSFSPALAEEKIKGAFGMLLGESFDLEESIGKGSLTDGTPMYQFKPKIAFRSFSEYFVLVTPKSHKVYAIWGIGDIKNSATCKKEQKLLMAILKDKYGENKENDLFSSLYDREIISQDDRYVMTKCDGYTDVTIEIRYEDKKYAQLAENERIELESKKLDSSGL